MTHSHANPDTQVLHRPLLTRLDAPGKPRGLVLMLHGGKETSTQTVDGRSASWRRSHAMQRTISSRAHTAGVSTWLLRYRHRGWDGGSSPIADARWALEEVRRELGDLPVVLLGHSMGGRTAIHVADDSSVVGVVALAPWFPPGESVSALAGKHLVAAHGRHDHITSPVATARFVRRARSVASSARLQSMGPTGHYMLRRVSAWNDVAASSALELLR